jgi:hypothetical protein
VTTAIQNDPTRKGELADRVRLFGEWKRYAVAPVHTIFDAVEWFVWDADQTDENGRPAVIRQEASEEEATQGLEFETGSEAMNNVTHSNSGAIATVYRWPAGRRGASVCADAGKKRRISVPYDDALDVFGNHAAAAQALCGKYGWNGDLRGGATDTGFVFVFMDRGALTQPEPVASPAAAC